MFSVQVYHLVIAMVTLYGPFILYACIVIQSPHDVSLHSHFIVVNLLFNCTVMIIINSQLHADSLVYNYLPCTILEISQRNVCLHVEVLYYTCGEQANEAILSDESETTIQMV